MGVRFYYVCITFLLNSYVEESKANLLSWSVVCVVAVDRELILSKAAISDGEPTSSFTLDNIE